MSTTDDLIPLLKKLRLSGVLQSLELRTRQAADDDLSHGEFLLRLLSDEVERRDSKQLDMRLRRASFEDPCQARRAGQDADDRHRGNYSH